MENYQLYLKTNRCKQIFEKRWLPALITFVTIATWGIVTTAIKVNTYEAEAKLKFNKINTVSSLEEFSDELEVSSTIAEKSNSINTEAEVVQSDPIIQKTIDELNLKDDEGILTVRDFRERLNVTEISKTNLLKITYQDSNPQLATKIVNTLVNNYLKNNLATNKIEAEEVRKSLEKQIPDVREELIETEQAIADLKTNNQILSSQEEVSQLLNSLENIENRLIDAKSQLSNINSQSQYIKEQLKIDPQQALNTNTISQYSVVRQIIIQLEELELQLKQEQTRYGNNHPITIDLKQKIRKQEELLAEQMKNFASSGFFLSEDNPQLVQTKQELAVELIKLESSSVGLTQEIAYLTEIEENLRQKAIAFPAIEQQLNQLERQLTVSQKTYELLENQLSILAVTADRNIDNVRVISAATVPDTPISTRSGGYILAITLGMLCAAAVVYFLEARNRSLRTVEKAKQLFGYNWLGIIPTFEPTPGLTNRLEAAEHKNDRERGDRSGSIRTAEMGEETSPREASSSKQDLPIIRKLRWASQRERGVDLKKLEPAIASLVVKEQPGSSVSESYRMLQSNLRFLNSDRQTQTIVITSSISQEGKSTVAANLAGAMAQVGHRVLLVDADLHAPTQHLIWDTYSDCGLSELLSENLDPRLITEQVMKNLSVVTSGKIPSSPATLLDSTQMKDLMYYWARNYDFVIIDSPSLDTAADAPILGRMADGVLLVVKPDRINRAQASFAKETLQREGINVLGLVFNDINPKVDASGHHYHPLKDKGNALLDRQLASEPEELWDTVCRIAQESPKLRLTSVTDAQQLLEVPIAQLEDTIDRLQKELEKLTAFVREQEDELFVKRQIVRKLQRKVNLAPIPERFSLEQELAEERENKQMLDRTIVGQQRNLARKREILSQYKEMLAVKSE